MYVSGRESVQQVRSGTRSGRESALSRHPPVPFPFQYDSPSQRSESGGAAAGLDVAGVHESSYPWNSPAYVFPLTTASQVGSPLTVQNASGDSWSSASSQSHYVSRPTADTNVLQPSHRHRVSGSNVQKQSVGITASRVPQMNSNAPVFQPQPLKPQQSVSFRNEPTVNVHQSHQTMSSHQSAFSPSVDLLSYQYQQHAVSGHSQHTSAMGTGSPTTLQNSASAFSPIHQAPVAIATSPVKLAPSPSGSMPVQSASRSSDIGNDMWRQLKRVSIPVFKGDKKTYEGWKSAFLACIDQAPLTPEYKLLQLREYLGGDALKVVENLGHSAAAYEAAKSRLERKYGGERRQMALHLEELEKFRPIRPGAARDVERFADLLDVAVINLKGAGRQDELGNGSFFSKLLTKMTEPMVANYQRWLFERQNSQNVETLLEWVVREAEYVTIAAESVRGINSNPSTRESTGNSRPSAFVSQQVTQGSSKILCPMCKENHGIWACDVFKKQTVSQRWVTAKKHRLCYRCLGTGHSGQNCSRTRQCGIDNCSSNHNRLLHGRTITEKTSKSATNEKEQEATPAKNSSSGMKPEYCGSAILVTEREPPEVSETSNDHVLSASKMQPDTVGLRTVPVILENDGKQIRINALLDDGSTSSFLNSSVASELNLHGRPGSITVNVLNGESKSFVSTRVNVRLKSIDRKVDEDICVQTADQVTGNLPVIDWREHRNQWQHLQGLEFPRLNRDRPIDMLIGIDHLHLHNTKAELVGGHGDPVARLTPLGWTCVGNPTPGCAVTTNSGVHSQSFLVSKPSVDQDDLVQLVRKFWEVQEFSIGIGAVCLSQDEKKAVQTVEDSLKYSNGRYTVGVPWRTKPTPIPGSYDLAHKRLLMTEKRILRDPACAKEYSRVLNHYLEQGYISRVSGDDRNSGWYLPHFPIVRMGRETTKVRVVFDAAARVNGVSLNSQIYAGPKLQRGIADVLIRFRQKPIAVVCDIAEMYLQIQLKMEDREFHRFLWREPGCSEPPSSYQFNRVVFGVSASPFLAQYVTQQHAEKLKSELPLAAEAVLSSTYMDDTMTSVWDVSEVKDLYQQLCRLWQSAGMYPRKWLSNSLEFLKSVPQEDRATQLQLDDRELPSAKTLGVLWEAAEDHFTFNITRLQDENAMSKRLFLRMIATLFDPLGFLGPFIARAKMLFQTMWLEGYDWDDPLASELEKSIRQWSAELPLLKEMKIPRCLRVQTSAGESSSQIHVFVDASQNAYGMVAYLVVKYNDGTTSRRLILSRNRVAPLSAVSIPRLELMAAVMGVEIMKSVATTLKVPVRDMVFWSDSADVLHWFRNTSRKFKPFVAHRVSFVQENTEPTQWNHVPTQLNPADYLTRGLSAQDLAGCVQWWQGPEFLSLDSAEWPSTVLPGSNSAATLKEMRNKLVQSSPAKSSAMVECHHVQQTRNRLNPEHFSDYNRYIRVRAWITRFLINVQLSSTQRMSGELTDEELQLAETDIIR